MAGMKGRSGRKPLSIEAHLLRGTYRPDRHGPRPAVPALSGAATALAIEATVPGIPEFVVADLGDAGRRFVNLTWREFEGWTGAETILLRQAARALDDAETATDARGRRLAVRLHAALVAQLGLGKR